MRQATRNVPREGRGEKEMKSHPTEWERAALGELVEDVSNGFASGARSKDGVAQLRMNNVTTDGRIVLDTYLNVPAPNDLDKYLLRPGDVVFNNTNSIDLVGKSAIFTGASFPIAFSNHFTRLRFKADRVIPAWVLWHLVRLWKRGFFRSVAIRHVGQAAVRTEELLKLKIPLPPIDEQRKATEIISMADHAVQTTEDIIATSEDLKKGLMQRLLTRGIGHTKFKKTEVGELPHEWKVRTLGEVGAWHSGGTPSKAKKHLWTGTIPWVSPKDMKRLRISDSLDHVAEHAVGNGARLLPPKSILIVVRGMILAHSFPVAVTERTVTFNQDIKACVPGEEFAPEFVLYWLQMHEGRIVSLATGSAHGTKRLATESLFRFPVPVPPKREQAQIVGILRNCDEMRELELAKRAALIQLKHGLMQQLLTGRLRVEV